MLDLIKNIPSHLEDALDICNQTELKSAERPIENIVITGLGGSGIGASIVADFVKKNTPVPIVVNKDYSLPGFVGPNTLVIGCSYSGNTEETLFAIQEAKEKGAMRAFVTSGGRMKEIGAEEGVNTIVIPGDNPPRSMLAYCLVVLMYYMDFYKVQEIDLKSAVQQTANLLRSEEDAVRRETKRLASLMHNKIHVTYACEGFGGVATRIRQQLNENSKMVGWDAAIPEMNHNELVGWAGGNDSLAVLFLRSDFDFSRNARRAELNRNLISRYTQNVFEIGAKGNDYFAQLMYLINFGDWLSYYLSELNGVDIEEVHVITELKGALSQF